MSNPTGHLPPPDKLAVVRQECRSLPAPSPRRHALRLAALAALCLAGGLRMASAAGITFAPATTIAADTDVYLYGSLRYAYNQANAASTVNGVPFAAGTSTTTLGGGNVTMGGYTGAANTTAFGSGVGAPWSSLSAAYQTVLRGGAYTAAGTPAFQNLNSLIAGRQYAVQFWVLDNRSCCVTRTETVSGGDNTVTLAFNAIMLQGGVGQYTVGYFTATGTTQSFTNTSAVSSQFNAIQLREVTGSWSGTAGGIWDGASLNFSGLSYSGVTGLGVTTVYFADKDAAGAAPMNTTVTIPEGGQTGASIQFQNYSTSYALSSSDSIGFSGAYGVSKAGGAAAALNGTHSYTGPTTVSAGSLSLNGVSTLPGTATVAAGATLSLMGTNTFSGGLYVTGSLSGPVIVGTILAGGGNMAGASVTALPGTTIVLGNAPAVAATVSLGALTLQGGMLNFDIGTTATAGGGVNDLIQASGGVTNTGLVTVNFNFTAGLPQIGVPYTLITSGALDPAFNTASLVAGPSHITSVFSVSGNSVRVTFTSGNNNAIWQGNPVSNTNWAVGVSGWTNLAGDGSLDVFYNADAVTFDDTSTNLFVNVVGSVFPASVTILSTNSHALLGSGIIGGGTGLTKDGTGTLTETITNLYSGPTVVRAGTLRFNNTNADPAASSLTVSNGATLDLNVSGGKAWPGTNSLAGSGTVRVLLGVTSDNAYLRRDMSGFTGTLDLIPNPAGKLNLGLMPASPAASAILKIESGATLYLNGSRNLLCNVEMFGGATGEAFGQLRIDGSTTNFGPILLRANTTIGNQGGAAAFGAINNVISDGGLGYGFTKQGNGIIVLSAANTFSGQTAFTAATAALLLNHVNALAQSTVNLTVANGLTFSPAAGATFTLGGLMGTTGLSLQNTAGGAINLAVGNSPAATTYSGAFSGLGSLTKVGNSTLTLSGTSTHTGTTFANSGVLQLGASGVITVSPILVGAAGTLDVSIVTGGYSVRAGQVLGGFGVVTGNVTVPVNAHLAPGTLGVAGTLSLSNTLALNGGTLQFDLADTTTPGGGVNDLIALNGPISLAGTSVVAPNLLNGSLAQGTYTLIRGITSITAGGVANIQLAGPTRQVITFDLVDQAAPGVSGLTNLVMNVSGTGGSVVWVGTNALWDAATTYNWTNLGTLLPDRFFALDRARFDDSLTANPGVTLVGSLLPLSVTVSNVNTSYTFSGSGKLTGPASLTKDGAGLLTLSTANDYAGVTVVRGGTLKAGTATALGSVLSGTFITNGGTLDVAGLNLGNEAIVIAGAGVGGGGAVRNTGAEQTQTFTSLALSDNAAIGGPNRWDVRGAGSSVNLNGFTLTKTGSNFISFVSALVTNNGSIVVDQGILAFEVATTVGGSGAVTLNPATALNVGNWGSTLIVTKPLVLNGGTLAAATTAANGTCTLDCPVTLAADSTVNVLATAVITLRNGIDGTNGLTKIGPGVLSLAGTNSCSGPLTISAGNVSLTASGSLSNVAAVHLSTGTQFDALARGGVLFKTNQTLSGSGAVLGAVTATGGSQVIPGGAGIGTLALNNGLSLSSSYSDFQLTGATNEGAGINDLIQVTGNLALSGVTTLRITPAGVIGANPYTLFTYSGALTGGPANFIVTNESRHSFALDFSVTNKIRLVATGGAGDLLWVGGNPDNVWNTKSTANWDSGGGPDLFFPGDTVSFVNGAIFTTVSLSGLLQPGDVNAIADEDYIFEGPGRITGGRLNKNGAGTLTLLNSSTNAFAAGTIVSSGTLQLGNGGNTGMLPDGPLTNNSTLVFNRGDDIALGNVLAGSGLLRKRAASVLSLSGANAHTGSTIVEAGTLRTLNNAALGAPAATTVIGNGASLDISASELWNYTQPILMEGAGVGGAGAITKSAVGNQNGLALRSITLNGDAAIGGVTGARIDIGRGDWGNNLVNPPIHIDGQGHALSVVGQLYLGILAGAQNLSAVSIESGSVVAPHSANSLGNAVVTINGGTFSPWGAHEIPNALVVNSGFIDNQAYMQTYSAPVQINGSVQINTISGGDITFSNNLSGSGLVSKIGAFTLLLAGENGSFAGRYTNEQSNTFFTGLNSGSEQAAWVLNNGNLANTQPGAATVQLGSLSGAGGQLGNNLASPSVGEATFVVGSNGLSSTFAGRILDTLASAGTVALVKVGPGTLALSGVNTHSGSTTISNGTLLVHGALAGNGSVVVAGGTLGGNGVLRGPVTVLDGGALAPGASIGALTISNNLTLAGTTLLELNKSSFTNDLVRGLSNVVYGGILKVVNLGGALAAGDTFQLFDAASRSGGFASFDLPPLPSNLEWHAARLLIDGTIAVVPRNVGSITFDAGSGTVDITFGGIPGNVYRIQAATTLSPPADWTDISTNTAPPGGLFGIQTPVAGTTNRFFRTVTP